MFFILGTDGKEYGPVSVAKIQEWTLAGRANLQTQARRPNETEWHPLGEFPEFNPAAAPVAFVPVPAGTAFTGVTPADPELADRLVRLGSFLIDYFLGVLATVPGFLILGPSFLSLVLTAARGQQPDVNALSLGGMFVGLAVLVLGSLALLVVQVWMLSTRGQTLGKRALGIRVVLYAGGGPAGFMHGWLLRNFVPGIIKMLPWIGLVFFLVDACMIFSDQRRCLHDLIAGTKVVKVAVKA
jgi:uncharacterized RDD family membrane protein YckC